MTQPAAPPPVPEGMTLYYLVLLLRGPAYSYEDTPEVQQLHAAHLAHRTWLRDSGKVVLNGPLVDDGNIRGLSIFKVDSREEAVALTEADPAVQAGRFDYEVHPWMTQKGILP
jgi:uncharacterized protein